MKWQKLCAMASMYLCMSMAACCQAICWPELLDSFD
jgi:hypothetical protein